MQLHSKSNFDDVQVAMQPWICTEVLNGCCSQGVSFPIQLCRYMQTSLHSFCECSSFACTLRRGKGDFSSSNVTLVPGYDLLQTHSFFGFFQPFRHMGYFSTEILKLIKKFPQISHCNSSLKHGMICHTLHVTTQIYTHE